MRRLHLLCKPGGSLSWVLEMHLGTTLANKRSTGYEERYPPTTQPFGPHWNTTGE